MRLVIAAAELDRIARAAEAAYPEECCGLLIGARAGAEARVARVAAAANLAGGDRRRRFEIDPAVLLAEHRRARETGAAILGPYHSHPDGRARPSAADRDRAAEPGAVWLIQPVAAGRAGAPAAFLFDGDDFAPAELASDVDRA